jgi:hypothetical protein
MDTCALLLRNLLAIGSDMAVLLRVIGGLDLTGMLVGWCVGPGCDASGVEDAGGIWCCVLLGIVSD